MAVNHLTYQGRLVAEPAFGDTNGGTRYANFRLAWSKKFGERESKCFLECKAFSKTAEFMENYMHTKGQEIVVEGELNTEEWEKEGQKRSKIVLVVTAAHFSGKKSEGQSETTADAPANSAGFTAVETDELPF